jgi:hypothetical protein
MGLGSAGTAFAADNTTGAAAATSDSTTPPKTSAPKAMAPKKHRKHTKKHTRSTAPKPKAATGAGGASTQ